MSLVILKGQLAGRNPIAPQFSKELGLADSPRTEDLTAFPPHDRNSQNAVRDGPRHRPDMELAKGVEPPTY